MNLLPKETVGQRIRLARKYLAAERQQKVSQADLAELCGWGQTRIANYERDLRRADADAIQVIARTTGCRAEWIQFGTGTMHAYQEGMMAGAKAERDRQRLIEGKAPMEETSNIQTDYESVPAAVQQAIKKLLRYQQDADNIDRAVKVIDALLPERSSSSDP